MKLRVRWFNSIGCELARCDATDEEDAAKQLIHMLYDVGLDTLNVGDCFTLEEAEDDDHDEDNS